VDIIFKGRHTDVLERFRRHATAKLSKIARLDSKAIRVDVEVSKERNPRQSGRRERVELTISSRGPAIRAEAAAEDRFTALDMAFAKLESRLRRAGDRRKCRHAGYPAARTVEVAESAGPAGQGNPARPAATDAEPGTEAGADDDVVAIQMDGEGPLVVREKFHGAAPMSIDQALFEMEMVGHDFFLFRDSGCGEPSVVYRRRGYQYGVLRLVEDNADRRGAESWEASPLPDDDFQPDEGPRPDDGSGRNGSRRNGRAGRNGSGRRGGRRAGKAGQVAGPRDIRRAGWPAGPGAAGQEAG
jgi:ribosomal subunit interface protein